MTTQEEAEMTRFTVKTDDKSVYGPTFYECTSCGARFGADDPDGFDPDEPCPNDDCPSNCEERDSDHSGEPGRCRCGAALFSGEITYCAGCPANLFR